jgi:hypothetical protein
MKKLPSYAKSLLLTGASTTGTFSEGYFFIEEQIQVKDANILFEFCKWIDSKIGGAASGNIDMLFSAFKNPNNQELANKANELAETIKYIKSLTNR